MDFNDFIYMSELGFLIEAPVLTTSAKGKMSRYVDPKTGKAWRTSQTNTQLQIIKNEHPDESLYVHFTDGVNVPLNPDGRTDKMPKFGINPMADDGNTPLGLYAYPIDYVLKERVPYGSDRKHMLVFKAKKENVLSVSRHGKQMTDFDEILKSLKRSSYTKGFRSIIEKQSKYFKKLIEKITQTTKEELQSNFPEYLLNYMFRNLKYQIERKLDNIDYDDNIDESLELLKKEIFDISIFFKKQLDYFRSHKDYVRYDDQRKEDYKNLFMRYLEKVKILNPSPPGIDSGWEAAFANRSFSNVVPESPENIDLENLTVDLPGGKKSLLDIFSSSNYTPYERDRDPIFDFLIAKLISKNESSSIFERFKEKMKKVREKIDSFQKKTREETTKKLESFDFPFKDEFIKIAKENNLDLIENLIVLLSHWDRYGSSSNLVAGGSKKNDTSNFVYRLSGTMAKDMAKKAGKQEKYYVAWTSILRRMGFRGIVDDEGTGTIYSGESTQSVFFDPKQVQLVAIIKNHTRSTSTSGLGWDEEDSALMRWYRGIMSTTYPYVNMRVSIRNKWDLVNVYNNILKKLIPIHSFLRFANEIKKEIPDGEKNFKSSLARSLGRQDGYASVVYFLNNYEAVVENIKNNQELMSYAEYARELLQTIIEYTENQNLSTINLPKPSKIRGIIEKIKRIKD